MVSAIFCVTAAVLQSDKGPAKPIDLEKITRTILKEPTYYSKQPRYCLLVFGPEATTRVWLVADGLSLLVDRNRNGDLTDPAERIDGRQYAVDKGPTFELNDLTIAKDEGVFLRVYLNKDGDHDEVCLDCQHGGRTLQVATGVDPSGVLRFSAKPDDAPILHFNGPLQMSLRARESFRRGPTPRTFTAMIGTPGLGPGTFVGICTDCVPAGVHPLAEITWRDHDGRELFNHDRLLLTDRC